MTTCLRKWKITKHTAQAIITPIYKGEVKSSLTNYQPVELTFERTDKK